MGRGWLNGCVLGRLSILLESPLLQAMFGSTEINNSLGAFPSASKLVGAHGLFRAPSVTRPVSITRQSTVRGS